jgi:hypothetical protein
LIRSRGLFARQHPERSSQRMLFAPRDVPASAG